MASVEVIRAVGKTLVSLLKGGLAGLAPPVKVLLSTPEDVKTTPPDPPAVTIFLYHLGINGEMRNTPRRSSVTGSKSRPALPLELRFLITPWTETPENAYLILGHIARLFYENAVLTFGDLEEPDVWTPDDTVEIMMESLPVEQQYDIWEPTDLPYRTSLAYLVRVVGIDPVVSTIAPPVTTATFQ